MDKNEHRSLIGDHWQPATWEPAIAMIIPITSRVTTVIQTGALQRRLFRGLDRVYVSEFALIRVPRFVDEIRTLRQQFPQRLRVVPFNQDDKNLIYAHTDRYGPVAAEQMYIGKPLANALYEDLEKYGMPTPEIMLSLGEPDNFGTIYGWPIDLGDWEQLDSNGIKKIVEERKGYLERLEQESGKILSNSPNSTS